MSVIAGSLSLPLLISTNSAELSVLSRPSWLEDEVLWVLAVTDWGCQEDSQGCVCVCACEGVCILMHVCGTRLSVCTCIWLCASVHDLMCVHVCVYSCCPHTVSVCTCTCCLMCLWVSVCVCVCGWRLSVPGPRSHLWITCLPSVWQH